jgi:hypothetical protein
MRFAHTGFRFRFGVTAHIRQAGGVGAPCDLLGGHDVVVKNLLQNADNKLEGGYVVVVDDDPPHAFEDGGGLNIVFFFDAGKGDGGGLVLGIHKGVNSSGCWQSFNGIGISGQWALPQWGSIQ